MSLIVVVTRHLSCCCCCCLLHLHAMRITIVYNLSRLDIYYLHLLTPLPFSSCSSAWYSSLSRYLSHLFCSLRILSCLLSASLSPLSLPLSLSYLRLPVVQLSLYSPSLSPHSTQQQTIIFRSAPILFSIKQNSHHRFNFIRLEMIRLEMIRLVVIAGLCKCVSMQIDFDFMWRLFDLIMPLSFDLNFFFHLFLCCSLGKIIICSAPYSGERIGIFIWEEKNEKQLGFQS